MRTSAKAAILIFTSFLAAIAMAVGSAFAAALAFGATALIVPGTGTPNANIVAFYEQHAQERYITPFEPSCDANCTLTGINYPASFYPLAIIPGWCRSGPEGCDKWNESVGKGTSNLTAALTPYLSQSSNEQVVLFGYSQGGAIVSNELRHIAALNLDQSVKDRLSVVTIGGIENPDGGLWTRLGFLPTIPFLDITFGPAMKANNGFDTTAIGFEYDPVTYAPRYWGNALALLNAAAALATVHGFYVDPTSRYPNSALPYGYTAGPGGTLGPQLDCTAKPANCRYGSSQETTYVMIPATTLPIFDLVMGAVPGALKPLVQPVVNLLTPVTKLLIDLGYDWSGDPDKATPLSILPFNLAKFNPIEFSVKFVAAIAQGIKDALNGGPPPTTVVTTTVSTMTVSTTTAGLAAAPSTTPALTASHANKLALVSDKATQPAAEPTASNVPVSKAADPVVPEHDSANLATVPAIVATAGSQDEQSPDPAAGGENAVVATNATVQVKDATADSVTTAAKNSVDKNAKGSVTLAEKPHTEDSIKKKEEPKRDAGHNEGSDISTKATP